MLDIVPHNLVTLQTYTFKMPKPNGWKVYLYGYGTQFNTSFSLMDDQKPPNAFNRFMQKHILGIVWEQETKK